MSGYEYEADKTSLSPFSGGALRGSNHPRLHSVAKPYARPTSMLSNGSGYGAGGSPTKSSAATATSLSAKSMTRLPRSGSEGSLFSGLKSMLAKPLAWLATPKRDAPHDVDAEDPESPTARREGKRPRVGLYDPAPTPDFQPHPHARGETLEIQGRAVSGFMLPPLPPNISLSARPHHPASTAANASASASASSNVGRTTNFSRPLQPSLSGSRSMPYLDPPSTNLASPARRPGALTRSRRMELVAFGNEHDDPGAGTITRSSKGKEAEQQQQQADNWSPWKDRYNANRRSGTPQRMGTPQSATRQQYTLPSISPFKAPASPSHGRRISTSGSLGGLSRSNTIANIQRAGSVASDVSMGRESHRSLRRTGSMMLNGDDDARSDRMSVDGETQRPKEGAPVLDWFMRDRWNGQRDSSPASRAASARLGSVAPPTNAPPIRRGQMVWHADQGFVRESDLRAAETPAPVHANDAERILFALESIRKTPLSDARRSGSSFGSIPSELIGSSSRTLRKAINVPLATTQAGDSARARRDKDRGEDLSVMISPYGRRRQVDKAIRDARSSEPAGSEYAPSRSASQEPRSDRSSRAVTDHDMEISERETTPPPQPTPRRSSRLKRADQHEEQETPKAKKSTKKAPTTGRKKIADAAVESTTPKQTPRRTRRATAEKEKEPSPERPAVPSVPTITETAPSPGDSGSRSSSTYQVRDQGEAGRGGSSLRAKSDLTKRQHVGAASLSRSTTPGTGRYSAREEDLPEMDELEQTKISLPSFSGINFGSIGSLSGSTTPKQPPADTVKNDSLSASAPPASSTSPTKQPSLGLPSTSRATGGPLSRFNTHKAPVLRSSSPLASGSITAAADSPPRDSPSESTPQPTATGFIPLSSNGVSSVSTTPAKEPPASLFTGLAPKTAEKPADGPAKTLGFGFGKPSAPPSQTPKTSESGIPNFFGGSTSNSGTTTPVAPAPFQFGNPSEKPAATPAFSFGQTPAETAPAPAPPTSSTPSFSFGQPSAQAPGPEKPAEAATSTDTSAKPALSLLFGSSVPEANAAQMSPFSFGSATHSTPPEKPAGTAPFSFSAPSASAPPTAQKPATPFSFGGPATKAPEKPASTPFAFGTAAPKPAEAAGKSAEEPKSTAAPVFGGFSKSNGDSATTTSKPAFSFGSAAAHAPTKPAEAPAFGFGNASTPSATNSGATPAFNFGSAAATSAAKASEEAPKSSFSFGAPSANVNGTPGAATPAFSFGKPAADSPKPAVAGPTFGSAATPSATPASTPFGSSTGMAATGFGAKSNGFGGASQANGVSTGGFGTSSGFGSSAPAAQPNGAAPTFGGNTTPTTTPSTPSFGFGAPANPAGSAQPPQASTPGGTGFSFTFGQTNPSSSPGTFSFGAPSQSQASASAQPAPSTGFGGSTGFGATSASMTPSSSFTFGQPQPATNAGASPSFGFGAPATSTAEPPRFGSPGPAAGAAAGGGGFSLGLGGEGPPGSPGRRQIKPLRSRRGGR